jgi:hypothetical protein
MIHFIAMAALFEGVSAEYALALETLVAEHRPKDSGDPLLRAQASADINGDSLADGLFVFTYRIGENRDHTATEYLTIVSSSPQGYTASWPIIVGARGFRTISAIEAQGSEIVLRGDFTVSDGTANMATLPATGEIYYSYVGGVLREQGGSWARKPGQ